MEIITKGRNFRLVDESELPQILEYLEQFLPESLKFHQTIRTYLNDRVWKFYFYVSKDWPDNPICLHFPGCTLTPNNNIYESFAIFCPTNLIESISQLATENVLIDWQKTLYLNFTHKDIIDRLESFYSSSTGGTIERLEGDVYVYDKLTEDMQIEDLQSDEVEMRPLTVDNVKVIHDLYPASEIECVDVFEKLIQVLPGVGIFKKDTDEIAAWMVHSYYGAMFSMQTKPEFRRKGYGIHLARNLTKQVISRGYRPFVVIRPENEASRNLYTKIGFKKAYETVRVILNPAGSLKYDDDETIDATTSSSRNNNRSIANEIEILQREMQEMYTNRLRGAERTTNGHDKKETNGIVTVGGQVEMKDT